MALPSHPSHPTAADPTAADPTAAGRRIKALAVPFHRHSWTSVLRVDRTRIGVAAPIRVGVAVGFVLVVAGVTGHRDIAGFAALGALTSAFCRPDPHAVRLARLGVLGVGLVGSVLVGSTIGIVGAPPIIEVLVISVMAGVAAMTLRALHIVGPGAVIFVFSATGAAGFAHTVDDLGRATAATAVGSVCGVAASLTPWLLTYLRPSENRSATPSSSAVRHESIRTILARRPSSDITTHGLWITVAGVISGALALSVGLSHPLWATMGAVAAMQGVTYRVTVDRAIARLVGNVGGALVAAALLALPLGYWGAIGAIVILQTVAEIMAPVNYAVTSLAVTPMALLLTALSAGLAPEVALDRVVDTLIGVVIGVVVAALTISRNDAHTRSPSVSDPKENSADQRDSTGLPVG